MTLFGRVFFEDIIKTRVDPSPITGAPIKRGNFGCKHRERPHEDGGRGEACVHKVRTTKDHCQKHTAEEGNKDLPLVT